MDGEASNVRVAHMDSVKQSLSGFKEVLAVLWELLSWKRDWYPVVLVSAVTFVYTLIWWNDVTVLTTFSLVGIVLVCLDLASIHGRAMLTSLLPHTPERERQFTDLCIWLSQAISFVSGVTAAAARYRETNSILYYTVTSTTLLILAWVGSSVPNLLLCYWATAALVLAPGLTRNGMIAKYASQVYDEVHKLLRRYLPVKKTAEVKKNE